MPKLQGKESTRKTYPEATTLIDSYYGPWYPGNGAHKCAIDDCTRTFHVWDSPGGAIGIQEAEFERCQKWKTGDPRPRPQTYDVCPYHVKRITDPPF